MELPCSISIKVQSYPIFIVLSGLCLLLSFYLYDSSNANEFGIYGLVAALITILLWLFTRNQKIVISSAGQSIIFKSGKMDYKSILATIDLIEKEMLKI